MSRSDIDRRRFLEVAGSAALAALATTPHPIRASDDSIDRSREPARADAVIVLWMAGGMAHLETFDPKRFTPFETGMRSEDVCSTFPSIPTLLDGVRFSEGLEKIGRVIDRGALIRSHVAADLGAILHSRHQYHWHTGYEPPAGVAAPHLGAWIAHALGSKNPAVPAYIDIGQKVDGNGEGEELKAFQTGGILGTEFGPFRVAEPESAVAAVRPPAGMTSSRFQSRHRAYRRFVESSPIGRIGSDHHRESLLRAVENADRLLNSSAAKAFDLSLEPRKSFERYDTGRFGQGCLLARRLVEEGARYVEVTTEYIPFLNWDTHDNGHTRLRDLKKQIDAPVAQLILDLEERGLLDRTLVVLASEFSRSVMVEGKADKRVPNQVDQPSTIQSLKHYGHHRHFTGAGSVLLFGGGIKRGLVYGRTADEMPCTTVENPVTVTDLHATIYRLLGIRPNYGVITEGRPFYVTKDGLGRPVEQLLG
ncbi:MAG: DUF1501 domain-containing protein [Isosphaeraceae bacterium]|nr:DUF1501 domain-containing protein [Isosphaeraceae bacterium]